ncbi:hypothetical protein ACJMK2_011537 [Sinanodonta woodiana]|uniref:Mediator of RNA polymerase II transcription subunit 19 n=1 Tax=Sinanodonta woodiana TaxID=1069815 RepID=A0ABD3V7R3_SINWO
MNETIRRPDQISPKSSPRGSRSPAYPRTDSSGTLKTTISLGRGLPSVIHSGPFYLVKDIPEKAEITGSTNLMEYYGLEHSYNKFCSKKGKEELSAFLPHLPGYIDAPGVQDNSSLRSLIEKPPIVGKELQVLSGSALSGFRLHPGPLPEQYRFMSHMPASRKKNKHKRKREHEKDGALQEAQENVADSDKKHKKRPKTEEDSKESKDSKKEKRKKKKKKKVKEKEDGEQS